MVDEARVPIDRDVDIVTARQLGRELAARAGFQGSDLTLIATAISEVARNITKYAARREVLLKVVHDDGGRRGIRVIARDDGPGIENVELALQDGYTSGGAGCRARGGSSTSSTSRPRPGGARP